MTIELLELSKLYLNFFGRYQMFVPSCSHFLLEDRQQYGFIPSLYINPFFWKLIIFNFTLCLSVKLLTLKKNQVVCPFVLLSTLISKSYSNELIEMAKSRFPHQKFASKRRSSFLTVGFIPVNSLYSSGRIGKTFSFQFINLNSYFRKNSPYIQFQTLQILSSKSYERAWALKALKLEVCLAPIQTTRQGCWLPKDVRVLERLSALGLAKTKGMCRKLQVVRLSFHLCELPSTLQNSLVLRSDRSFCLLQTPYYLQLKADVYKDNLNQFSITLTLVYQKVMSSNESKSQSDDEQLDEQSLSLSLFFLFGLIFPYSMVRSLNLYVDCQFFFCKLVIQIFRNRNRDNIIHWMNKKLPKYVSDESDMEIQQLQNKLKQCLESNRNRLPKTPTNKLKPSVVPERVSEQSEIKIQPSLLSPEIDLSASPFSGIARTETPLQLQKRYGSTIGSHKFQNNKRLMSQNKRKKYKELKDVILNQKVTGLKELFCAKIKRNNPYSQPIDYQYQSAIQQSFMSRKGIELESFEKLFSLIYIYNIVSSIFILTLSMVFAQIRQSLYIRILETIGATLFLVEIALNFITVRFSLGRKLESIKEISEDYFRTKFGIDCLNFFIIVVYLITRDSRIGFFRLITLLKLRDCMQKIEKLQIFFIQNYYNEHYWSLIKVFLFNFCFAHMLAIILIGMSKINPANNWVSLKAIDQSPWYERYIWSYYWGTTIMLTIGFGDMTPVCYQEALCMVFIETISCMVLAYNINCVGSLISEIRSRDIVKSKNLKIFKKLADKHEISEKLSWKINSYIEQHTNIKKLFNIEEQAQFVETLPTAFRTDYLKQANKKIFQNLFFFRYLMEKTLFSFAEKIEMKITHPQEIILNADTYSDVFILKTGEIGYISRKGNRKYNKYVFDRVKVQEDRPPFLLNTAFITSKRPNYGIKSIAYSVLYCLGYKSLIETLQETHLDYELFCRMRDKSKNKLDQFEVLPCQFCLEKHTKFSCPKLHFMPIEQHIINKYISREQKDKNKRVSNGERNQLPKQSALAKFLYYSDIYDQKKREEAVTNLTKKYRKQKFVIDQLKGLSNDELMNSTGVNKKEETNFSLNSFELMTKFQSSLLENTSEMIKMQINRAFESDKYHDDVWMIDLDRMKNYKDYFAENNPCNLTIAFDAEQRIKHMNYKVNDDSELEKSLSARTPSLKPASIRTISIHKNTDQDSRQSD